MINALKPPAVLGLLLVTFIAVAWTTLGLAFVMIVALPTAVAYFAWLKTTYRSPISSNRVVAVYLLAIAVQIVHLSEEYLNEFWDYFNAMFYTPIPWGERLFTAVFVLTFPFLFVVAAFGLLYKNPFANYIVWWFALGPNLANFVAHLAFPFIYGGYVPGLYTAPLHGVMAVYFLRTLIMHHRASQARPSSRFVDTHTALTAEEDVREEVPG